MYTLSEITHLDLLPHLPGVSELKSFLQDDIKNVIFNKIWWLCLVPTSTTGFAGELGYRMAKIY